MAVTSTVVAGINVWQFSGAVTDLEIKTAWASLIVNGVYVINRAIYLDNTADLTGLSGGFLVNFGTQVNPAFILHTGRDKSKSTFNNFTFIQSTGLSVGARSNFVNTWNGSTLSAPIGIDGVSQKGGGMIYGVVGNPGGGDPRFLNEMSFASLEGVTIYSQEFTEQELQPVVGATTQLKGLSFEKCFGFPQIGAANANVNVVVYRSTQNTQHATQFPLRVYPSNGFWGAICYVDSYVTRNNADITTRLADFYGSSSTNKAVVMILNNFTKESWFGASKTSFSVMGNWNAANQMIGGVLKKMLFVNGNNATIRCYDSRSEINSQKCAFVETGTVDFLSSNTAPTTDNNGKISIVHIGAIATGASVSITRYTNQRYTFQKFGLRVIVGTPDMTLGDNDLSAFTPISTTVQEGLVRSLATINAATSINNFHELLEELHVLAIGLIGSQSYNGAFGGNLFNYDGSVLSTSFTTVNIDKNAVNKIAYNASTNTLTIQSDIITDSTLVKIWNNASGNINLLNGATIRGIYTTTAGTSTILELRDVSKDSAYCVFDKNTNQTILYGTNSTTGTQNYRIYFAPGASGTSVQVVREKYGYKRASETITLTSGLMWYAFVDQEDAAIASPLATVQSYTVLDTARKLYDYTAYKRLEEKFMKLGQITNRGGSNIELDANLSMVINKDAVQVLDIVNNVLTIKTPTLAGDTFFSKIVAFGTNTITRASNEIITINIEDANGDSSINIQGGSGSYEIWKVPNGTAEDNYASGTKLADTGLGIYRFVGTAGFYLLVRDKTKNNRDTCSMAKGNYDIGLYSGSSQIQLAQAPLVIENNSLLKETLVKLGVINQGVKNSSLFIPHKTDI